MAKDVILAADLGGAPLTAEEILSIPRFSRLKKATKYPKGLPDREVVPRRAITHISVPNSTIARNATTITTNQMSANRIGSPLTRSSPQAHMGHVNLWGQSDTGRQRTNNEDSWFASGPLRCAVVADGMGGQACGEVASGLTIRTIEEFASDGSANAPAIELLREAVRAANQRVIDEARWRPACAGMGSTVVVARWEGQRLSIASVGDSRAYLFRDGRLSQLTYDQNLGNELRDSMGWTEEQISQFPQRHVLTAAVGAHTEIIIREVSLDMMAGDWILLCSDGLYGPVGDASVALMLSASASAEEAVRKLIDAANQAGGPDNITVVLLEYKD